MIFQGTTGVYERIYRNFSPSSPKLNFESFVLFRTEREKSFVESLVLAGAFYTFDYFDYPLTIDESRQWWKVPSTILYIRRIKTDVFYAISEYFRLIRGRNNEALPGGFDQDRLKFQWAKPFSTSTGSLCFILT